MDARLILAVFNYPELFNITLPNYRCTESRAIAWRNISITLGIPSEECKRKWKNLRDRYLKEVRMEIKSKKQGDVMQSKWKYRQLMNFIAPFTGSRGSVSDICGNPDFERDSPDLEPVCAEGETPQSESVRSSQSDTKVPVTPPESKSLGEFVAQVSTLSHDKRVAQLAVGTRMPSFPRTTASGKRKPPWSLSPRSPQSSQSQAKCLTKDNGAALPPRIRDEDELFLLSFVPALKRLSPQKRCETKIRIQQIMYEAEFNVAQEKKESNSGVIVM